MEQAPDGTWVSMVPPLVAIGLAIALRHAILSLCLGVYVGILIIQDFQPFVALQRFFDTYLPNVVGDESRAAILLFCLLLSGMVTIAASSGGLRGLSQMIERAASTPQRAQVGTWLLGMAVFIDDYANSLLVGSTLRPTMDRLKISRAKLAFLVDSTAAPVASLAVISSWIAAELLLFFVKGTTMRNQNSRHRRTSHIGRQQNRRVNHQQSNNNSANVHDCQGVLELHPSGYGFLRRIEKNLARLDTDVFVP